MRDHASIADDATCDSDIPLRSPPSSIRSIDRRVVNVAAHNTHGELSYYAARILTRAAKTSLDAEEIRGAIRALAGCAIAANPENYFSYLTVFPRSVFSSPSPTLWILLSLAIEFFTLRRECRENCRLVRKRARQPPRFLSLRKLRAAGPGRVQKNAAIAAKPGYREP